MLERIFLALPVRRVSLRDLRWGDNGINKDALTDPYLRREIDELPIWVEQLVSGHFFVHDGRHRALRALRREEHEIDAHALMNSTRREYDIATPQASLSHSDQTAGTDYPLFPVHWLR